MIRTPMPPILYLVVQDFGPGFGIGSGDVTGSRDTAYDNFADAAESGRPVAVWEIATHGGLPVCLKDATDTFERELQNVCIARDLDWPTVRRIEDAPALALMAAE
ncbi:hypothetical protein [Paracoccus fontiphilus]|uniref:Uncharacterized protein n=1 Tax=Paracoccus fontiphilus TaxID=1815556 RepID=A0ABV7IF94_9RHOB|nr:hypothetical protein [Paracoccus fontiphilus]